VIGCGKWRLITLVLPPRRLVPAWCSLPLPRLFLMLTRRLFLQLMGASGVAMTASDLLSQAVASASPAVRAGPAESSTSSC
jgi:hypothetical protein